MRFILRRLKERGKWSQEVTGKRLGIGQQSVGKILSKNGGFSRPTALALARLSGFESPEDMLRDLGVLADVKDAPEGWVERDLAVGTARRIGYEDAAIDRVIARHATSEYASKPARWWMDRIVYEAALARDVEAPPPSGTSLPGTAATSAKPSKKRRSAT